MVVECVMILGSLPLLQRLLKLERASMYAVIKTGGKQYKVVAGEKIKVEQIAADVGQELVIDQILAVGSGDELKVGTPLVAGATVIATVLAHGRHDKVRIFKMRRRKHYKKSQGHRQNFTELSISAVNG
jgi:large subunit ribosomal protein L21